MPHLSLNNFCSEKVTFNKYILTYNQFFKFKKHFLHFSALISNMVNKYLITHIKESSSRSSSFKSVKGSWNQKTKKLTTEDTGNY